MTVDIVFAVVLVLIGIYFYLGKGADIIKWLNTMPIDKKERRDMVALSKFIGKLFFVACGCIILMIIGEITDIYQFNIAGVALLIIDVVFGYFYTHSGDRFNK
ncbi:MAG: DUF3784 domain-containing protein [Clostridia bacterium]|nr:DUF3784 domain-containing protein [Clostridia bacterium]